MSLACKLWDLIVVGVLEKTSLVNAIFLSIVEAKAHCRAILAYYLKNWMQKNKDKWSFNRLMLKKRAHSLMKRSISWLGAPYTSMVIGIKWCFSWNPIYLRILAMALNSTATPASQLMTFKDIISCVELIITSSAMKIWSFWVMYRLIHDETLDIRAYHHSIKHSHSFEQGHTWCLGWQYVWLFFNLQTDNELNLCQMRPIHVHIHMWKK